MGDEVKRIGPHHHAFEHVSYQYVPGKQRHSSFCCSTPMQYMTEKVTEKCTKCNFVRVRDLNYYLYCYHCEGLQPDPRQHIDG